MYRSQILYGGWLFISCVTKPVKAVQKLVYLSTGQVIAIISGAKTLVFNTVYAIVIRPLIHSSFSVFTPVNFYLSTISTTPITKTTILKYLYSFNNPVKNKGAL